MFCYDEKCKGKHDECKFVERLNNNLFFFQTFTDEDDIEIGREILCLVTSWEEPPYFVVMRRFKHGICNSFTGKKLENTRIIKWAYLPAVQIGG